MTGHIIPRALALAAITAAVAIASPAAATTFTWTVGGDFDVIDQFIAPTYASQLTFFGGDNSYGAGSPNALAHSHGQDVNFTITATIDGTLQTIYSQLLTNGQVQFIPALGTINFTPGTVTSIGFGCDNCSFNTYHQFGYNGESGFSLTAGVPEPASWALMIVGFGIVGVSARRRSRATIAA